MPATVLAELSYDAAIRALDLQERAVEQLRARTGTLLAASSLIASFLGALAIQRRGGVNLFSGLALVSLTGSIGLCAYVLLPKPRLVFSVNGLRVYTSLLRVADDEEEVRKRLIKWLDSFWRSNQAQIDNLDRYYVGATVTVILQLVCWSATLTERIV